MRQRSKKTERQENRDLDLMSTSKLVDLFLSEEQKTISLLKKEKTKITIAINQVIKRIHKGGRVIYIGSGTSGRLGVLDAVECKPTFGTSSFLGIIAGGRGAIFQAKEGVEDNKKAGPQDLKRIFLSKNDVVVGISASGTTPYTVTAISYAKKCRALTISITSESDSLLSRIAHFNISPMIKDEIIHGSSRLKSGTAQKIILNVISSISMIKSGRVYKNLMLNVEPNNKKLVERAIRIISSICKLSLNKAKKLFYKAKKNTKAATVMHFKKCNLDTAKLLLKESNFNLRRIIG